MQMTKEAIELLNSDIEFPNIIIYQKQVGTIILENSHVINKRFNAYFYKLKSRFH